MILVLLLAAAQGAGWRAVPAAPTVGDTIWVERTVAAPPGWVVRPGAWEPEAEAIEALGPVGMRRDAEGAVVVRYPLVAWEAGSHTLTPPPLWRIGPRGEADSVPGGVVLLAVASVLPADSLVPRPPRPPLERQARAPLPAVLALIVGAAVVAGLWRWRRRASRPPRPVAAVETGRTLEPTGDARVDAARLAARLRSTIAQGVPAAHGALTTTEVLTVVAAERPDWPLVELRDTLHRLDNARFAPLADTHLMALAEEVATLERAL